VSESAGLFFVNASMPSWICLGCGGGAGAVVGRGMFSWDSRDFMGERIYGWTLMEDVIALMVVSIDDVFCDCDGC
jgi:hypothetical protein